MSEDVIGKYETEIANLEQALSRAKAMKEMNEKNKNSTSTEEGRLYLSLYKYEYDNDNTQRLVRAKDFGRIGSFDDVKNYLPNYEIERLLTKEGMKTPYRGIVGEHKGFEFWAGAVENRYELMSQEEALDIMEKVAGDLNFDLRTVYVDNNRLRIDGVFPEMKIYDEKNMPIYAGMSMQNGVGGVSTFNLSGYTHQEWCSNGCYHTLAKMKLSLKHTIQITDYKSVVKQAKSIMEGTQDIFNVLREAMEKPFTQEYWESVKGTVLIGKKLKETIDALVREQEVTHYGMWRNLTSDLNRRVLEGRVSSISVIDMQSREFDSILQARPPRFFQARNRVVNSDELEQPELIVTQN